jgi:hypothetical protein
MAWGISLWRLEREIPAAWLLALALDHGGRLVSFDRRLSCEGVAGWACSKRPDHDEQL